MGKRFNQVLGECRGGLVELDLSQKLSDLVTACQESGKKGTITVTMTIDPHGAENREMHVSVKSAVKAPAKPDMEERSIFFAVRGDLVRDDPNQQRLGLRGVDSGERADGSSPAEQRDTGHRAREYGNA